MESEQTGIVRHQIGQLDQYEANPQPTTTDDAAEVESATCFSLSADANNVRSMTPAQCRNQATAMTSEKLAEYVAKSGWGDVLRKLVQLKPYVEVLWGRFDELKRGEMIAGCRTKGEFCEKCLNRSIRAVQYMLYGRTPDKPKANIVRPGNETSAPSLDNELIAALITQGYKKVEAVALAKAATGSTFQERFKSAIASRGLPAKVVAAPHDGTSEEVPSEDESPQPPLIIGDPVSEPDPDCMEELRQRICRTADTGEIEAMLEEFLDGLVTPLLEHHAYDPTLEITVRVGREGYLRVAEGDWVECEGSSRFTKLTGQETPIGKVVGVDGRSKPRIRWYDGSGWTKPYSFSNEYSPEYRRSATLRVLFPYQAAELYPEVFASYAAEAKGKKVPRKPAASVTKQEEESPVPNSDEQAAS